MLIVAYLPPPLTMSCQPSSHTSCQSVSAYGLDDSGRPRLAAISPSLMTERYLLLPCLAAAEALSAFLVIIGYLRDLMACRSEGCPKNAMTTDRDATEIHLFPVIAGNDGAG